MDLDSWSALAPALVVLVLLVAAMPFKSPLPLWFRRPQRFVSKSFTTYLSLHEAEALDSAPADSADPPSPVRPATVVPLWRSLLIAFAGLVETLAWVSTAAFDIVLSDARETLLGLAIAFSWAYTVARTVAKPPATAPYDLIVIYFLHLFGSTLHLGGFIFEHIVSGAPLPSIVSLFSQSVNLAIIGTLLFVTMGMPIGLPSARVQKEDIGSTVSPEDYTSFFGWISFRWVYPLIQRGSTTTLDEKDIWRLSPSIRSKPIFIKFQSLQSATLIHRIWEANSLDILLDFFGTLGSVIFAYAGPFFLKQLLDAIDSQPGKTSRDRGVAYGYAALMFICSILKSQFDAQHLWYGQRAATRIRSELMAAIYDKALKRKDFSGIIDKEKKRQTVDKTDSKQAKADKSKESAPTAGADTAKIVNLMSGDAERIATIVNSMYFVYGAPLEFAIGSLFLYQLLGWSAFSGFIAILAGWPLNNYLAERNARINKGVLGAKDKRLGEVNELLGAIKFVKFFSWEEMWIGRAMEARDEEMAWRLKGRINNVLFQCVWTITPIMLSIISFTAYVWLGNELTIAKAFTALALFNLIRAPINLAPLYIVEMIQARIALDRIAVFLGEAEVGEQVSSIKRDASMDMLSGWEDEGLGLENASFKWNEVEEAQHAREDSESDNESVTNIDALSGSSYNDRGFTLKDVSVLFPEGVLTVVTGPTASGKTALLLAVLGEMTLLDGRIVLSKNSSKIDEWGNMHTISYTAQTPWLRHESIKDNILFGSAWDEERYRQVLECCALNPDLDVLEDGDATEIGAKGVNLSGGQKARVALARAIYARTRWLLLDDPLSAVDSQTAHFLYDRLLRGPLLENRTVVLVTHHVDLVLPGAHYLIRMKEGRIESQGTIRYLQSQGLLEEITQEAAMEVQEQEPVVATEPLIEPGTPPDVVKEAQKPRKLVEDEHRETGNVKWSVYKVYLAASGYWVWGIFLALVFILQLKSVGERLWIKVWGEAYEDGMSSSAAYMFSSFSSSNSSWPSALERPLFYAGIYAAIGFFGVAMTLLSTAMEHTGALNASHTLYRQMLEAVVRATFRFHDTTPLGRILNRFGRDIEIIDNQIAWSVTALNNAAGGFIVSVVTVLVVFPLFVFPASIIGYFYRALALGYLRTGRDLRRMESNSRSPIVSDFAALLEGVVTVRAFSAEKRLMDKLHERVDASTQLWYAFWMINRWLLLNFDFLGSVSVFTTACFAVTFLHDDAGLAGLAITSALSFSNGVFSISRFWTALELDLNCVERIVEYLYIPQEPPAIIDSYRPPAYWPSSRRADALVTVENLVVKYAPELPAVLRGVSFSLNAGWRVGLVGRTGSGKSTLATSLLRFVDPSSGKIIIDGVDISKIGLHDLRSRITFIPQEAALFSGSIRDNLDPFGEYDDLACMNVLYRVHLVSPSQQASREATPHHSRPPSILPEDSTSIAPTEIEENSAISLDTQVSAAGANFSQGQKQLIALARALLRRSTIVILDEATSSIDFETDAKIQKTIREEFTGSLLITVAHRLRTIMDYDRIIVLDQGQLVEFDAPSKLIEKDGIFRDMCVKSGAFGELEEMTLARHEGW